MIAAVLRVAARRAPVVVARRAMSVSAVRCNLIQDLYVKEIKGYKAPPLTVADAQGSVKPWVSPSAPAPPAVEGDVAADLAAYESSTVEVESHAPVAEGAEPVVEDWFVIEPAHDLHH
ncbi:uncharacterized protein SAPINGB_P002164 [Magnusiomyces paraingens]|uniref:ATP synthase subunit H, mitochondrial n=1 Tax=Magnusiomyces paraingens TaxID=2606893 RepID=A0A5E8BD43_9ASCO|nr:uncharacterized protein SAPINGB_P002164 [Saprochaete ingens]VVT49224.1 unnamed protein product [Saprochaete ingens]